MRNLILFITLAFLSFRNETFSQFDGIYYEDRFNSNSFIDYSDYEYAYFTSRIMRFRRMPFIFDFFSPVYVGISMHHSNLWLNPRWNYNLYNPHFFNPYAFNSPWDFMHFNRFNHWTYWNWNQPVFYPRNIVVSNTHIHTNTPIHRTQSVSRVNNVTGRPIVQSSRGVRTPVQTRVPNNRTNTIRTPQQINSTEVRQTQRSNTVTRSSEQRNSTPQRSYQVRTDSYTRSSTTYSRPEPTQSQRTQQPVTRTQTPQRTQQPVTRTQTPQRTYQQPASRTQAPQRTQQSVTRTQTPQRTQQPAYRPQTPQRTYQQPASRTQTSATRTQTPQAARPAYRSQTPQRKY